MKIPKAAELLGRSNKTVRTWIKSGMLRAVKLGRDWDISAEEVERIKTNGIKLENKE